MLATHRLGIDIGGTKINAGIIREDGTVLDSFTLPSRSAGDAQALVAAICDQLTQMLARHQLALSDIHHIGVGIPGTADPQSGMVRYSPNLFGENMPLGQYFEQQLGRSVTVVQDSWAGAWAEYLFGQQKKWDDMLCLTIGTGIGCGVILNGKVYGGAMRAAGEIGHTPIVPGGRLCSCGQRGCLEAYTSGTAMWDQAMERFPHKLIDKPQQTETLFDLAYAGDSDALALIADCVDKLAYGLAVMVNILSINAITVSGGICAHEKLMIEPLPGKIRAYGYPAWASSHSITVTRAGLGSLAPMVGAAFLTTDCIV